MTPLTQAIATIAEDLEPHVGEFDAVVTAGDMHGVALGAIIASMFDKPFMAICRDDHSCVVSHIVTFGDLDFRHMRYLYVDDAFTFGASLDYVFAYTDRSGTPAPITATYEVTTREYKETGREVN